jgi:hypothetical protein
MRFAEAFPVLKWRARALIPCARHPKPMRFSKGEMSELQNRKISQAARNGFC